MAQALARERSRSPPRAPHRLTPSQRRVVDAIARGDDCRITANAGSGKTTTLLAAFENAAPSLRVLFLEYNRSLKEDVQAKVRQHERLQQVVEATNYDSVIVRYYDSLAPSKDFQLSLLEVIEKDPRPLIPLRFDVLVLDECQDLDRDYLDLIKKLLRDNGRPVQLISMGDPKQTIYRYRGASPELFLDVGDDKLHTEAPVELALGETFRFGPDICRLVDVISSRCFPKLHLPHSCALDRQSSVERYVMPARRDLRPEALLARLRQFHAEDESPMAWLAGTKRSNNVALWDVVEAFGEEGLRVTALTLENPEIERWAAQVHTAHSCKGKTFRTAVVFFTNKVTWIDCDSDAIKPEIAYVALTRAAERLVIVESEEGLVFDDILRRLGVSDNPAVPRALDAVTGEPHSLKRVKAHKRYHSPKDLLEMLNDADAKRKQRMLELVSAPWLAPWPRNDLQALPPLSPRACQAVWLRLAHDRCEDVAPLWGAIVADETPEEMYAKLCATGNRRHRLTPHLRESLLALQRDLPAKTWSWNRWLDLAQFLACFHYGHSALPEAKLADADACELYLHRLSALLRRPQGPLRRADVGLSATAPLACPGIYLGPDAAYYYVLDSVDAERAPDRLLAAAAVAIHDVARYELHYLARGEVCRGTVEARNRPELARALVGR